ncbi:retrovirus-related Pol polyprotein from transposon TNT 1-94 [Gossypium australe]|uniref:Retrovirus-related Pol polyprotein from transposon TNT 1-94 n=1 Tax=Gossypium australe TaxID=47621 RepID=A0A5B6WFW3_9ROSI|nr:retrovirus-related Pol polyprotein from transposon TNT 1-94 [Gossypium australe]
MTSDKSHLIELTPKNGGEVTFGDNFKWLIEGIGSIGINSFTLIKNVLYVNGLKHNLLSISKLCDKGFKVIFESNGCKVVDIVNNMIIFVRHRVGNIFMVHLDSISSSYICFMANNKNVCWLWHKRRLGHVSMSFISKLIKNELVVGMPNFPIEFDKIYDACAKGKHRRQSFKSKNIVSTSRVVQLIHIDLFGPTRTMSLRDIHEFSSCFQKMKL